MERRLRANGLVFLLLSFVQADYKATLAAGAHLRNESKRFALREGRKSKPFMEKRGALGSVVEARRGLFRLFSFSLMLSFR
jgi:hypothetical protein